MTKVHVIYFSNKGKDSTLQIMQTTYMLKKNKVPTASTEVVMSIEDMVAAAEKLRGSLSEDTVLLIVGDANEGDVYTLSPHVQATLRSSPHI